MSIATGGYSIAIEKFSPQAVPHQYNVNEESAFYDGWIPTGLFWDLYDTNNETQQATIFKGVFVSDCFTRPLSELYSNLSGCQTVIDYRAKALTKIPSSQKKCMEDLFAGYGY
jgi:hypothetical protein